ncbi:MAG TPA: hypothetical protein VEQ58_18870, partial [Polyangiaceae bacterium]|nr:hypothetical protein [Polyangiaceae bacterium]
ASLEHELGREVVLTDDAKASAVQIRFEGAARVDVHYTTPSGEQLSRSVELPPDRQRAVQVVSWLTVNLVRDEASELLDELRARRRAEAAARAAEAERVAAEQAAADKAAADKAAADKAAADKAAQAAADEAKKRAEQAKLAENGAGGPPNQDGNEGLLRDPIRSFDLALATPISILQDSPKRLLNMQVALAYGDAGGIDAVSASLGALRVRRDLRGVASAVGAVFVGGNTRGLVASVGYVQANGVLQGALIGGGAAWQRGKLMRGVLIGGGGALAGELIGIGIGGGFVSVRSLDGVAIAAGATVIRGRSKGLLVSGAANVSSDHRGIELSGAVNSARDLDGIALAPLNVHRRVKGLQFGVINVAEQVDGAAIGVISYAKNGRLQPVLWAASDGSVHTAIKSIAGYAFTQIGAGIDLRGNSFSYDGGVGLHLRLSQQLFLEPGVHYSATNGTADASGAPDEQRLHYLVELGYRVGNKVDLLAGAGVRHTFVSDSGAKLRPELRAGIAFF